MTKNITLILFLSKYDKKQKEVVYDTDDFGQISGTQTNQAPVIYAIRRLVKEGGKLSRVIALTTELAKETAFDMFRDMVMSVSPGTKITVVDIKDDESATDLLRKTLETLPPIGKSDSVVIETTGGYRTAMTAITLLSRFLRNSDVKVEFSTYSDLNARKVGDTKETDELYELLDAVNVFAATGNARNIKKLFDQWKLPEKKDFFVAANKFYNSLLVCRTNAIESDIKALGDAIKSLRNAKYDVENAKLLIFRELVLTFVEKKMTFLNSASLLADFIKWCGDNWYLQQAVTFLKESLVPTNRKASDGQPVLSDEEFNVLRVLRNSINHASGEANNDSFKENAPIKEQVTKKVNRLLEKPDEIKGFIDSLLKKINRKV
jgi:hypothetical protein